MREDDLFAAWDDLSDAIDRVICSLPHQMSESIGRLEDRKLKMRKVFQDQMMVSRCKPHPEPAREEGE